MLMSEEYMLMAEKRTPLWDNLKFILIVLVVLGHFINIRDSVTYHSIFIFIYSFHMPLFLFLAGLFHKNRGVWKKAAAFLAIYVLYELAIFGTKKAFGVKRAKLDLFSESAAPWFMLALCVYVILGYFLYDLMKKKTVKWIILSVFVVLSCIAGYIEEIGSFLSLSKIINFFPFFLLGMIMDREKLEKMAADKKIKPWGAVVLLLWIFLAFAIMEKVYLFRPFFVAKESYPEYSGGFGALWKISAYAISCITGWALIMITPAKEIHPITLWGSRTIQVYFWHKIILYVFKYTDLDKWFYSDEPHKLLWMGVAVAVACVLSLWIFRYPTELIMGLTRSKEHKAATRAK